jgi:hypothetical protein
VGNVAGEAGHYCGGPLQFLLLAACHDGQRAAAGPPETGASIQPSPRRARSRAAKSRVAPASMVEKSISRRAAVARVPGLRCFSCLRPTSIDRGLPLLLTNATVACAPSIRTTPGLLFDARGWHRNVPIDVRSDKVRRKTWRASTVLDYEVVLNQHRF